MKVHAMPMKNSDKAGAAAMDLDIFGEPGFTRQED